MKFIFSLCLICIMGVLELNAQYSEADWRDRDTWMKTEALLLIGSGAIESAHKDVLQKRLKLPGQRWTKKGLQQMAQLRVAYKSGKWNQIKKLCLQKAA